MRNLCRLLLTTTLVMPLTAFAVDEEVNINNADEFQLSRDLTGVTKQVADNIVEYREKNGAFDDLEEMERVEGVGYDTLNINRESIVLGNTS